MSDEPVSARAMILVIEDNPASQMLIRAVLEGAGYEVEVAANSTQARVSLSALRPALILMDVQLPGEDGLSLARWLRFMPETKSIPIVALTAGTQLKDRQAALEAGCVGFISKPIDTRAFPSRVAEFLTAAQQQSEP